MPQAAQLATHAAPPATPRRTQAHAAAIPAGLWLFMLAAPISFALILAMIIYLSAMSF